MPITPFALTLAALLRDVPCEGCLLEVPEKIATPAPLVVALHGDEGSPAKIAALWAPIAREKGFILLAPRCPKSEGCDGSWWRWNAATTWLEDQIQAVDAKHPIDRNRRWLTAWSGGASYASLHMPELAKTFAAFSLAGGGIATESTACLENAGGACAPVHLLAGELNPHHHMTERTRRALEGCRHQVSWALQKATDHAGEWRAYVREAPTIADWLAANEMGCTEPPASASPSASASAPASESVPASASGLPSGGQPPSARGCACSTPSFASRTSAPWCALIAIGCRMARRHRRRSRPPLRFGDGERR
jgi:poly(3-hydroxybutyrate) depolymerase